MPIEKLKFLQMAPLLCQAIMFVSLPMCVLLKCVARKSLVDIRVKHLCDRDNVIVLLLLDNNAKDISALKVFAEQISKLHVYLSLRESDKKEMSYIFDDSSHQEDTDVKEWKIFVEGIFDIDYDKEECVYFTNLQGAVRDYYNNIYPYRMLDRMKAMTKTMEIGKFHRQYIKIFASSSFQKISVKLVSSTRDYEQATRNNKWYKQSMSVATYQDDHQRCFHVVLYNRFDQDVYLLGWRYYNDANVKEVKVPSDGSIVVLDPNVRFATNEHCVLLKCVENH